MERPREEVIAGALFGTLAGDALGAPFEGREAQDVRGTSPRLERSLEQDELAYTDDTQLAIALAEHLCDHPRVEPAALVATILDHYEPWRGYGAGMHALVDEWRAGTAVEDATTTVFPDGSFGNGAAMRVAPVGVLWSHDPTVLREVAARQAAVTHVHPLGIGGAVAQASAVGLAAERGRFGIDELEEVSADVHEGELRAGLLAAVDLISEWDRTPDLTLRDVASRLGNAVVAHRSVPAALWCAATAADLPDAVDLALGVGGDADTIAAMAGAVAGAAVTRRGIPDGWIERFEDGPRGRSHVLDLSRRLAAATV